MSQEPKTSEENFYPSKSHGFFVHSYTQLVHVQLSSLGLGNFEPKFSERDLVGKKNRKEYKCEYSSSYLLGMNSPKVELESSWHPNKRGAKEELSKKIIELMESERIIVKAKEKTEYCNSGNGIVPVYGMFGMN